MASPTPSLFSARPHDAGCSRLYELLPGVRGRAVFGGPQDCYRYLLEREWGPYGSTVLFVMMNPSGAAADVDDNTVRRVQLMVRTWGDLSGLLPAPPSRLWVCNTFGYRATDQGRLLEVPDPVGPDNLSWILRCAKQAQITVLAYGAPKAARLLDQVRSVTWSLRRAGLPLYVLRHGKEAPWHPLYLRVSTRPVLYAPESCP